jgi:hypothetical protein
MINSYPNHHWIEEGLKRHDPWKILGRDSRAAQ